MQFTLNCWNEPHLSTKEANGCTFNEVPITIRRSHLGISWEYRQNRSTFFEWHYIMFEQLCMLWLVRVQVHLSIITQLMPDVWVCMWEAPSFTPCSLFLKNCNMLIIYHLKKALQQGFFLFFKRMCCHLRNALVKDFWQGFTKKHYIWTKNMNIIFNE